LPATIASSVLALQLALAPPVEGPPIQRPKSLHRPPAQSPRPVRPEAPTSPALVAPEPAAEREPTEPTLEAASEPGATEPTLEADADEPACETLAPTAELGPPPPTPTRTGSGLLIGGSLLGASALVQHLGVYLVVRDKCTKAIEDDATFGTRVAFSDCLVTSEGALALRVTSTLTLGASVGLIAAGATFRGRHIAHVDAEAGEVRRHRPYVAAGGVLLGVGGVSWVVTRALVRANGIGCDDERCAVVADMLTLDASAIVIATGAALLGRGLAYRNRMRRLTGAGMVVSPWATPRSVGLTLASHY
jgi:hypothetical protein